jgi:hypothetical protein
MDIGMSNDGPSKMPCFIMIFKAFQAESVFFEKIASQTSQVQLFMRVPN